MIYVAIGGFFGAICRFLLSAFLKRPFGTLFVNGLGAFLLGLLLASTTVEEIILLGGTGFLGAFTTFSTFAVEAIELREKRGIFLAASYVISSVIISLLCVFLGLNIGKL